MTKILSRDDILGADDRQIRTVAVPEWGGEVLVRGLTGAERDRYEESLWVGRGKNRKLNWTNARAKLVAASVVGEDGKPLFTQRDVEALGAKSSAALDRIYSVAQELSGVTDGDMDEMLDEMAGNS